MRVVAERHQLLLPPVRVALNLVHADGEPRGGAQPVELDRRKVGLRACGTKLSDRKMDFARKTLVSRTTPMALVSPRSTRRSTAESV